MNDSLQATNNRILYRMYVYIYIYPSAECWINHMLFLPIDSSFCIMVADFDIAKNTETDICQQYAVISKSQ